MENIVENNQDIMKNCDEWLSQFYKCYDKFEEYVVAKREKYNNTLSIRINLFNNLPHSDNNDENSEIYGIRLDMANRHVPFVEGPSIVLNKNQRAIFKYLLLNIFCYYINKNYNGNIDYNWNGILYDDLEQKKRLTEKQRSSDSFMVMVLGFPEEKRVGFYRAYFDAQIFYDEFKKELNVIVQRHNFGINSISDILDEFKNNYLKFNEITYLEKSKLEQSKRKAEKVMELIINSKKKSRN